MKKNRFIILLFATYLILVFLINPLREFPLNDDWVHTLAIRDFLLEGKLFYSSWLSSNLHVSILDGILLGKVFGFSFSLFRIYNIIISFASLIVFYLIASELKIKNWIKYLLVGLFLFNPIFFNLSFTFMGDISSLFTVLLSIYLYLLGFKRNSNILIFLATLMSVVGIFIRQISIFLILASFVYYIYKYKKESLKGASLIYGVAGILTLVIYAILYNFGFLPGEINARFLDSGIFLTSINNLWVFLLLLTLFIAPLTIPLTIKNFKIFFNKKFITLFGIVLLFGVYKVFQGIGFTSLGNIISMTGLGPNTDVMQGDVLIWGGSILYSVINIILIILIPFNLFLAKLYNKKIFKNKDYNFVYIFALFYLLLITPIYSFDRYLLVILPILLIACGVIVQNIKFSKTISVILLLVMANYSMVGTYNYLSWNEVRWNIGNQLIESGVHVNDIEGGYEFNGWNQFVNGEPQKIGDFTPKWAPWYVKKLSQGHLMKFIISFSELGGYDVVEKREVKGVFNNVKYIYLNKVGQD